MNTVSGDILITTMATGGGQFIFLYREWQLDDLQRHLYSLSKDPDIEFSVVDFASIWNQVIHQHWSSYIELSNADRIPYQVVTTSDGTPHVIPSTVNQHIPQRLNSITDYDPDEFRFDFEWPERLVIAAIVLLSITASIYGILNIVFGA